MTKTDDAVIILESMIGEDIQLQQMLTEASLLSEVAQLVYDTRIEAGLTQQEFAELIGIQENILADLEDADYQGNFIVILTKIATVFQRKLKLELVSLETG